jgi:hypothetical protein
MGAVNDETIPDFDLLVSFSLNLIPLIIYAGASRRSKTESVMKCALPFVTGHCCLLLGFWNGYSMSATAGSTTGKTDSGDSDTMAPNVRKLYCFPFMFLIQKTYGSVGDNIKINVARKEQSDMNWTEPI